MKFSANTVLFVASSVAFGAVFAKADGGASLRSFPVLEPSGEQDNKNGGIRNLGESCKEDKYICGLDRDSEDKIVKLYSVCAEDGSVCVESKYAEVDKDLKKAGGNVLDCGCCALADHNDHPFCATDFSVVPPLDCGPGTCKTGYPNKVPFCFFDASYDGGAGKNRFKECDDPVTYPKYEEGDLFLNCGECLEPTAAPSEMPSSSPTDACLFCEEEPEYVYNPTKGTFAFHSSFARTLGCSLASVKNADEKDAVLAVLPPTVNGDIIILGGEVVTNISPGATYRWTDGSTGGAFTLPSTAFGAASTNDGGTPVVLFNDAGAIKIGAPNSNGLTTAYPAVYKCCSELGYGAPSDAYGACEVPAP